MMKKWEIFDKTYAHDDGISVEHLQKIILKNRGLKSKKEINDFLLPQDPDLLTVKDVEIDKGNLAKALKRIVAAIKEKESIVVYADYDADGICAGAIMWETLHGLGATVMPYIPHRVEEGYGLSVKGIDAVNAQYNASLIVTVDHGVTAKEKVEYAKKLGIDVVVTDHHVKPKELPDCIMVHTTKLCGSGISWFVAKELLNTFNATLSSIRHELVALAAIGTIADMVPLVGPNRAIVKAGLDAINTTERVGLDALINEAGLTKGEIRTYEVSHVLAPRLNAMGRIEHALDALRLLCTHRQEKAGELAQKLGLTNKERQQITLDTTVHAKNLVPKNVKKLIFVSHKDYNPGVIGLVAGKLVEEYYRPSIVVSVGEVFSKASARSIAGFNIVEAIRKNSDILVDVGGHPMAAGFTVETKYLADLQKRLELQAEKELDDASLTRSIRIDAEIPLAAVTDQLWKALQGFAPFGFGNAEPVFVSRNVTVGEARLVGADGKHLRLRITNNDSRVTLGAIAFGMGQLYGKLDKGGSIDVAYTIDRDTWNGNSRLQLKIKDIVIE